MPDLIVRLIGHLDVAAASGIVCIADRLYVVADDQLELAVYDLYGARVHSIALLPGELPEDHAARKAAKPDFEALAVLPDGSMLALGSGSTAQRLRGISLQLSAAGADVRVIQLGELYAALATQLPELNIEGAVVLGPHLYLCSRGNGARLDNALVQLDLTRALASLRDAQALTADCIQNVHRVQLGQLEGVPLSLTDLSVHGASLVFSAAAEASANTYDDGACAGSVVGKLSSEGRAHEVVTVARGVKLEGLCSVGRRELYAVADADDPNARAPLLAIEPWDSKD